MQERTSQSRPPSIYKPLKEIEPLALSLGKFRRHQTRTREPPDARPSASGAQELAICPPLNLVCQSLTVTYGPPDTTGLVRREFVKLRSHRTRSTELVRREGCKQLAHRIHTTGRTLSVWCSQSETSYICQATPDA